MKMFFTLSLIVFLAALSRPVFAAELFGVVYSKGAPVANLTVTVKERDLKTKTGPNGEYKLELEPGNYTLIIRGREFPIKIGADKTNLEIRL